MSSFMETKRKKPRFSINFEGTCGYNNVWEPCIIMDINLDGAGLNINRNFQNNELLNLKLNFNLEEVVIKSEVVYSKNLKTGVIFPDINPDQIFFLKNLINNKIDRFKI